MLRTCVVRLAGEQVDVVGEVLPGAGDARHDGLAAELALGADLARHARDFGRERAQLLDHRVERVLEQQDLAADVDGDLLGQVALGDGGGDLGDVADLRRQVAGHEVDAVGEVLPGAGDAGHAPPDRRGLPSVPTSRATRVTSPANALS